MTVRNIVVTGASGFVGGHLMASRHPGCQWTPWSIRDQVSLPDEPCDSIVHCAGLAHQMQGAPPERYLEINLEKTQTLAAMAKQRGVRQFVFLSTTKVLGEGEDGRVYDEDSQCVPIDPYGESKRLAEQALQDMQTEQFVVSILRPPLVFGPGVRGNFLRLLELCDSKWPLPLGGKGCQRSMVYIGNLVALIARILERRAAGIFIAGEAEPVHLDQLVSLIRRSLKRPRRLFPVPKLAVEAMRKVAPAQVSRLFDGFVIDASSTHQRLDFQPPYSTEAGIAETVKWYLNAKASLSS